MEVLSYAASKAVVSLLRAGTRIAGGAVVAHPDEKIQVPSRDSGRTINVNVYKSPSASTPAAVLINFHGSGWVFKAHGTDDEYCRLVATKTKYTVLDVQYRLAPENPYPAALNDAEDIINWVLRQTDKYDKTCVSISGFSAGSILAAVACACLFPVDTFKGAVLVYPPADQSIDPYKREAFEKGGGALPPRLVAFFNSCYVPAGQDPKDPKISPLYADLETFPQNVVLLIGACDSLSREGEQFGDKLEAAGKTVVRRRFSGCDHMYDKSPKPGSVQEKAKDEGYELAVKMLQGTI